MRDVEAHEEGEGNDVAEVVGPHAEHLEHLPLGGLVEQHQAVQYADEK